MSTRTVTLTVSKDSEDQTIDSLIAALHELRNEVPGGDARVTIAKSHRMGSQFGTQVIGTFYVTASWTKELKP